MFIADLHIHSHYSRATSRDCVPEQLDWWARRKGLGLIGTGDFTHPAWRKELREKCRATGDGLYTLREEFRRREGAPDGEDAAPRFILSGEISSIYKKNGRVRKVHQLILLPGLEEAQALSERLELIGNLHSDGRPILGLDSRDLLEITLEVCPEAVFIPAHIWTPHFSLFGAYSGFDRIEDCFEELTPYIHAVETGLSSDPPMNGRLSALDAYTLVSNSDAHSPSRLAREANLLDTDRSYAAVKKALETGREGGFRGTIEFFPEEGKYHYDGHRNCKVCLTPSETNRAGGLCPVCGRRITVGVLHRVEELADRPETYRRADALPFESLAPLDEVVGASTGYGAGSARVQRQTQALLDGLGPELPILRQIPLEDIERLGGPLVAEGIRRLRAGEVDKRPGYDGEYGKIGLLTQTDRDRLMGQTRLFAAGFGRREAEVAAAMPEAAAGTRKKKEKPSSAGEPDGLNNEQQAAVCAQEPVVAVSAGPGTGKTRTLVFRAAHLLEQGIAPSHITAVTFTNRAAREMRERLVKLVGKKAAGRLHIGTFHALCLDLLKKWDVPVRLLDEYDALALAEEVRRETDGPGTARDLLRWVSERKNGKAVKPAAASLCDAYMRRVQAWGAMDYDDILLETRRLLEEGKPVPAAFDWLLVDEFQDINDVQYQLVRLWNRGGQGLFVIGDPDQAIYGFRGADPRCFARLAADRPDLRQIRLAKNYRSTPEILACAGAVIRAGGGEHELTAMRGSAAAVGRLEAEDAFSEALFVAKEINRLVGGVDMLEAGRQPGRKRTGRAARGLSDIAVLYRTHRQAAVLEHCLQKEGIPYTVAGREDTLADGQVRRAAAFFRYWLDPSDGVALRILLRDVLGERETEEALAVFPVREEAIPPAAYLRRIAPQRTVRLAAALEAAGPADETASPQKLLEDWLAWMDLTPTDGYTKVLHMAALHKSMAEFLRILYVGGEADVVRASGRQYTPDAVSLMTLHGAKGLEFPVVFLCGVEKGCIPLEGGGRQTDREEERRLFYVGITRARDDLILLSGGEASPFFEDIPPALLEKEESARRPYGGRQLSFFDS